jgi:hypothetical protein
MSERSVYLRDQAEKCRAHAARMTDDEARQQLHVLAAEYIMRAVMIESDEPSYGNRLAAVVPPVTSGESG